MRRLLFIFLMVLLPVQWAWASAASVCTHEAQGSHFGHHEHAHQKAAHTGESPDGDSTGSLSEHPDCGSCHGMTTAVVRASGSVPALWIGPTHLDPYASAVPDRSVDTLLRPPLTIVS